MTHVYQPGDLIRYQSTTLHQLGFVVAVDQVHNTMWIWWGLNTTKTEPFINECIQRYPMSSFPRDWWVKS